MPQGLNKQGRLIDGVWRGGIEWTRIQLPDNTMLPGYTWNPVGGCFHGCRWHMPDGSLAICYAEAVAGRLAQKAYTQGFEHHYWNPAIIESPKRLRQRSGIFLDSMSDLFGRWVPDAQIQAVLQTAAQTDHIYFALTKNAPRLLKFRGLIPSNVWVGVSMPPDVFLGHPLSRQQQHAMLHRSLEVLQTLYTTHVTWMSFEPLSWDVSNIIASYPDVLRWAVIGAASNGAQVFDPFVSDVEKLLTVLGDTPIFYKGNLARFSKQYGLRWRDDFATPLAHTKAL